MADGIYKSRVCFGGLPIAWSRCTLNTSNVYNLSRRPVPDSYSSSVTMGPSTSGGLISIPAYDIYDTDASCDFLQVLNGVLNTVEPIDITVDYVSDVRVFYNCYIDAVNINCGNGSYVSCDVQVSSQGWEYSTYPTDIGQTYPQKLVTSYRTAVSGCDIITDNVSEWSISIKRNNVYKHTWDGYRSFSHVGIGAVDVSGSITTIERQELRGSESIDFLLGESIDNDDIGLRVHSAIWDEDPTDLDNHSNRITQKFSFTSVGDYVYRPIYVITGDWDGLT